MAIGTLAAVAIGAGALGSAAISSSASKKASKAATQAADQSAQVQREQLQVAQNALAPYVNQGAPASYAINSFLGLSPSNSPAQEVQPNALAQFSGPTYGFEGLDGYDGAAHGYSAIEPTPYHGLGGFTPRGTPFNPNGNVQAPISGRDAFRTFLDNSDYGFQFQEGGNALNSGYAGRGVVQSGAAMKGLEEFRQNLRSGYRGEFLNALGNQQGVGLSGASALAGVGQNYANSLGTINQTKADAIGNAALAKAAGINNIFGGITSAIGYGLGRK